MSDLIQNEQLLQYNEKERDGKRVEMVTFDSGQTYDVVVVLAGKDSCCIDEFGQQMFNVVVVAELLQMLPLCAFVQYCDMAHCNVKQTFFCQRFSLRTAVGARSEKSFSILWRAADVQSRRCNASPVVGSRVSL